MTFRGVIATLFLVIFSAGWFFSRLRGTLERSLLILFLLIFLYLLITYISRQVRRQIQISFDAPQRMQENTWFDDLLDEIYLNVSRAHSEKLQRESEVKELAARSDAVLDHMVEGVAVTDIKGHILLHNKSFCRFFPDEPRIIGEPLGLLAKKAGIDDLIEEVLSGNNPVHTEVTYSGGLSKTWSLLGIRTLGDSGPKSGYGIFLFYDLTEIRRLERVRKDFVANVSHEIRTPLTSISGFAEALMDGALEDPKTARSFLEIIVNQSHRLNSIVTDLLHLATLESGKASLVMKPVDLSSQVASILEAIREMAREKGIRLIVEIDPPNLVYETDEGKMNLVLSNLLDNALKYTPSGGTVSVGAQIFQGRVEISVSDSGVGIPKEDLGRIFERFYRVDRARSREMGGTGLGLSIVKHVLELLGGGIRVKSTPGEGSVFTVSLPFK
ncbi:MAG: ATP-binding protein [Nitrospiraceae bacterium]|jgi:two-component system phosphate regulon sensor histidine kinase PhoR|nr:ATP-binding protein [Nitrospiraceae bacterium]